MNSLESLFRQPWTIALGWTLLHFLWQGTLIALLFACVNLSLRSAGARLRYSVACLAMLLMPAASIATFVWLNFHSATAPPLGTWQSILSAPLVANATHIAAPGYAATRLEDWLNAHLWWLVSLWSVGVVILSLRTAGGWIVAQTLKRHNTHPAEPAWQDAMARLARRLDVRRRVRLCESTLAKVPTVIGWLRPVILLPVSALTGLTPELMETLLAHELAHIRRQDYLLNLVQTVIETLWFYHPAVWWIGNKIRQERENCCDDLAVAACGDALTYARALTELEQLRSVESQFAMAASGGSLLSRIRRLVGVRRPIGSSPSTWLAGIVALLTFGAVWAAGPVSISYDRNYLFAATALSAADQTASDSKGAEPAPAAAPTPAAQTPQPAPARPKPSTGEKRESGEKRDFIDGLSAAGYQNLSVDQLITFKIHDVTPEFVRGMEAAGLPHPTPDQLVTMKIHDVTPEFVNELKADGYTGLSIDQLVAFKIHGVDPARLKELQKSWGKLTPDQVVTAQIHGVTPEFAGEMKSLGLGDPSFDQIVAMKIHDVTPEFAKAIKATGLSGINLDRLVAFKIHDVDPAKVAEIQKLGFGSLTADEVVALQIHNVTDRKSTRLNS